jgi:hypothetical protein
VSDSDGNKPDYKADAAQIGIFVNALFKYAEPGTYISLRTFDQTTRGQPPQHVQGVEVNGDFERIVETATVIAQKACQSPVPAVFAPPICTFYDQWRARTIDLANGLTLSVELDDTDPDVARARLESILGPATAVVRSGSDWVSPITGEVKPKVHLHWRLNEPTAAQEDHDRLRQARTLAATLVGADPTGKPVVHPLRWPGSWNLKTDKGRMATIAALNESAEIDLGDALEKLEAAIEAAGSKAHADMPGASSEPQARLSDIRSAMSVIPNLGDATHYDTWIRLGYAVHRATGGGPEGFAIWDNWSRLSDKYHAGRNEAAWRRICAALAGKDPPRTVGAGTIFWMAAQAGWVRPFFAGSAGRKPNGEWHDPGPEEPKPEEEPEFRATPIDDLDLDNIPPRQWLYGHELVREFVSVLGSNGGVGKTAYCMAVGVSLATGRPLLGETVHKQAKVWFFNLEDPADELMRRMKATLQHHNVSRKEVSGRIFIDSGRDTPLVIAKRAASGDLIEAPAKEKLVAELIRGKIDVLVVDPVVHSHDGKENDNPEMAFVLSLWGQVAKEAKCAVWLIHHFRKGGLAGDAEAFRGASAISGAARCMHTLAKMTAEEAERLNVSEDDARYLVRRDNAKSNMAPLGRATWLRLAGVTLGNATADYPLGDSVQAVETWEPPSAWDSVTWERIGQILRKIDKGNPPEFYSMAVQAGDRWAGKVLQEYCPVSQTQALSILRTWVKEGVLEIGSYMSSKNQRLTQCVRLNHKKFDEMMASAPKMGSPFDG